MKRIFTFGLAIIISLLSVNAAERSEYEMQRIAAKQLFGTTTRSMATASISKVKVGDNYNIYEAEGRGFVVISNDDYFNAVLGQSDSEYYGEFMPDAFKWWLNAINESMTYSKYNTMSMAKSYEVDPIAPLIKSAWGQGYPFNKYCPQVDGTTAPTGCVATAMAQIMNYYEYPEQGTGYQTYTVKDNRGIVSTKFYSIRNTYDWANMLDFYPFVYTDEQADAVSKLMMDCGASVKMTYASAGSGAMLDDAARAFITNFGYNSLTMSFLLRDYYADDEWHYLLYEELSNGRPILYGGADPLLGGHAFIFDGMDKDGKVHVNWGWNGAGDGYFDFNNLNPNVTGTAGKYNTSADMITGIKTTAPVEGEAVKSVWVAMDKYYFQSTFNSIDLYLGNIYNISFRDFDGELLIVFENVNGVMEDSRLISIYSSESEDEKGNDGTVPSMTGFVLKDNTTGQLEKFSLSNVNFNSMKPGKYRAYLGSIGYSPYEYLQYFRCPGGVLIYTLEKTEDGRMTISEGDPILSGIENVTTSGNNAINGIYDISGMRLPAVKQGLNVVRQADGSIKKVMMK